ncbi:nucleotidyltransferase [Virgibacillus proomii]|uniref:nucleotidyltransferase n=1 Tax=Virgibacillus proomii TaxID=84407 RepID=UPI001C11997A|nr:nucleotidyltransferase [Virgibacillus proomii]MBU5266001.1 nucleotidyltransferase [Virgibacillus proomii]
MQACGLIVEYNPFHNGHVYHIQQAKKLTQADCIIAVMSGTFLQRGEPAIIDKFHRTKAALKHGVDLVIELPYAFAVQSSELFAKGAVLALDALGTTSLCFGSESGEISDFIHSYKQLTARKNEFEQALKTHVKMGLAFPEASKAAYQHIGLDLAKIDLSKPNNILGFSYVKMIYDLQLSITPLTVERSQSDYHDKTITGTIASATSIRNSIIESGNITQSVRNAIPETTYLQLKTYKQAASLWHTWEHYFPLLHYRIVTMSSKELSKIQGVDEGLEYRLRKTVKQVRSFNEWMNQLKTKRYTWTRLQRMFVHILTNTTKQEIRSVCNPNELPYVRILGFNKAGQSYLHQHKKKLATPIITSMTRQMHPLLEIEEHASNAYYSVVPPERRLPLQKQELQPPIHIF